jgi:hypothetical protein
VSSPAGICDRTNNLEAIELHNAFTIGGGSHWQKGARLTSLQERNPPNRQIGCMRRVLRFPEFAATRIRSSLQRPEGLRDEFVPNGIMIGRSGRIAELESLCACHGFVHSCNSVYCSYQPRMRHERASETAAPQREAGDCVHDVPLRPLREVPQPERQA